MSQNLLSKFFHELAELSTKYAALAEGMPEVPDNAGTGRKAKSKKDPNKPKRALTAYLCFVKSKMSSVQKKNPELKQVQIMQELGRLWKHLPDHKRSTFEEQSKQDKERHAREMAAYTPGQAPSAGSTSPDTAAEPAEAVEAAAPTRKRKSSDSSDKSTKKKKKSKDKDKKSKKKKRRSSVDESTMDV